MDLRYFMTFKTILETGSFQHAANKLGYTQSTVTFHISQPEGAFSIKLFEKIGRRKLDFPQTGQTGQGRFRGRPICSSPAPGRSGANW